MRKKKSMLDELRESISKYLQDGGSYSALSRETNIPFSTIRLLHQRLDRSPRFCLVEDLSNHFQQRRSR